MCGSAMDNPIEIVEMHAIFKGDVQGVGFRATARYHALQLGLKGSVCNLRDGTVEMYVQGSKKEIDQLMRKLENDIGINSSRDVEMKSIPVKNSYSSFSIIFK